jgi:hypothetical protein
MLSLPDLIHWPTEDRPKTKAIFEDLLGDGFAKSRRLLKRFRQEVLREYTVKNCEKASVDNYIPITYSAAKAIGKEVVRGEELIVTKSSGRMRVKSPAPARRKQSQSRKRSSRKDSSDTDEDESVSDVSDTPEIEVPEIEESDSSDDDTPVVRRSKASSKRSSSPRRSKRQSPRSKR